MDERAYTIDDRVYMDTDFSSKRIKSGNGKEALIQSSKSHF